MTAFSRFEDPDSEPMKSNAWMRGRTQWVFETTRALSVAVLEVLLVLRNGLTQVLI